MKELMIIAFSGEGAVVLQIIAIGIGSWIGCSILNALGKGAHSKFVQTAATFISIGLAVTAIAKIVTMIL